MFRAPCAMHALGAAVLKPRYDFATATFLFFLTLWRRPAGVLWIGFWQVLIYILLCALLLVVLAPVFEVLLDAARTGYEPDPEALFSALGPGFAFLALSPVLGIMIALALQGAWLRLLARDEIASGIPLRFGGDELRLLVVVLFYIAVATVLSLLAVALTAAGAAGLAAAGLQDGVLIAVIGFLWTCLLICAGVYIAIRLAPAASLTVRRRKLQLFEALRASANITGWMFLSYLVLVFVILFILIVAGVFQQVAVLLAAANVIEPLMQLEEVAEKNPEAVFPILAEAFSAPGFIAAIVIVAVLQFIADIFTAGLWHGVGAYAARREAGDYAGGITPPPGAEAGGD